MKIIHGLSCAAALLALATTASAEERRFHANLVGGHEIAGGDPNGAGTAAIQFRSNTEICVALIVSRIATPTAAHIHQGYGPSNGPVVITLPAPEAGNPGSSFGCFTISASLGDAIRKNPSEYYVNIHTPDFPGGALRGQLF